MLDTSGDVAPKPSLLRGASVLVLVHTTAWGQPKPELLEAIRAELRGLGATLIVVSEGGSFHFRPDEDTAPTAESNELRAAALQQLLREHTLPKPSSEASLGLSIFEEDGTLRFRLARNIEDSVAETLLEALRLAGLSALESAPRATMSRRELVIFSLVGALTMVMTEGCKSNAPQASPPSLSPKTAPNAREVPVVLNVNGHAHELRLEPRVSLLDALRERLGLYGTKKGCDHGQCGACTVLLDDRRVNACLTLALMAQGKRITTIEGLAAGDALHPLQQAFIEEDALQCGYCTPGQIMSAMGLLKENRAHTDDEVREHMSGNLCRCGAYLNIVRAIQRARKDLPA